jgi:hypothetical protein
MMRTAISPRFATNTFLNMLKPAGGGPPQLLILAGAREFYTFLTLSARILIRP